MRVCRYCCEPEDAVLRRILSSKRETHKCWVMHHILYGAKEAWGIDLYWDGDK